MFEVWAAWTLGCKLSAENCTVEPYVPAEPFIGDIDIAFEEISN